MSTNKTDEEVSADTQKPEKPANKRGNMANMRPGGGIPPGYKVRRKTHGQLTPAQKAEAAALWRSGEITLDGLSKRFKKRPETFSRLFKEMGITKGESAKEHQAKVVAEVEARLLNDSALHAQRIAKVKDEHFRMADSLGKLVWRLIAECVRDGKKIDTLRGTMHTLQMAGATLSKSREEIYAILRIEEEDKNKDVMDLPELTVRELTEEETADIRNQKQVKDDELELPDVLELPSEPSKGSS